MLPRLILADVVVVLVHATYHVLFKPVDYLKPLCCVALLAGCGSCRRCSRMCKQQWRAAAAGRCGGP